MTREEIEHIVKERWGRLYCKGPPIFDEDAQADIFRYRDLVDTVGALGLGKARRKIAEIRMQLAVMRAKNLNLPAPTRPEDFPIQVSDLDTISNVIRTLIYLARVHPGDVGLNPCGYPFVEILLSNPLDGARYDYQCPRCGVKGIYDAPKFE